MDNKDKKEMLEMFAECVRGACDMKDLHEVLLFKASSLPQDKPDRKMPEIGKPVLFLDRSTNPFSVFATTWHNTVASVSEWNRGFVFLMSEREQAEKKVNELNKILAS